MGIIQYTGEWPNRKFNVGQAIKDGWGLDWQGEEALIGVKLQDRKKARHKVEVDNVDWFMGILRVWFKEGGWLCLDHAIEQFKKI